jgi:DNA/RNA-binding domain of Phe-tRNA-synthetase-like protein
MKALTYSISADIFERFPGYVRGVVTAREVRNRPSPEALVQTLREAEASVRGRLQIEGLAETPRIKSWREAYRSFGAKPSEFRSSIEALVRRVLRGDPLPSINALVDIGNVVSLRHLVPAGGHALDVLTGDIALRPATGREVFTPFGSDKMEHPLPGEVIFAEEDTVLTRRWTWRQANHTLTRLETRAIEFNVDGLPPVTPAEVEQACGEIVELLGLFCGGETRWEILSESHPRLGLFPAFVSP